MMKRTPEVTLEANLAVYDLYPINGVVAINEAFDGAKVLKRVGFNKVIDSMLFIQKQVVATRDIRGMRATMLESKGKIYFFLESRSNRVLLCDDSLKPYFPIHLLSAYLTIILVILISVALILYKLQPLRAVTKKLRRYAAGDRDLSFAIKGSDEIATLANELERARKSINALIESRTMFLRNVMHELKTPIAKGRITTEMLQEIKQKQRLKRVFIRLESLINEFALIEEVSSGAGHIDKKRYRLADIVDEAIDQSMLDSNNIESNIDDTQWIVCDFKLMATAFKNMIDNGVKYSTDGKIVITSSPDGSVLFSNRGRELNRALEYYIQPFSKESSSKDSFGLGLYLVNAILTLHSVKLGYRHLNQKSIFEFIRVCESRKV